jgi:hypothetical protein
MPVANSADIRWHFGPDRRAAASIMDHPLRRFAIVSGHPASAPNEGFIPLGTLLRTVD